MKSTDAGHETRWPRRLLWLVVIWAASVSGLGLVALGMRLLMRAAGLTA